MAETIKKVVCKSEEAPKVINYTLEGGNDWTIVAKKFLYGLLFAIAGIVIPYTINFFQTEDLTGLPTWFLPFVPVIVAILLATQNAWAHRLKITKEEPE